MPLMTKRQMLAALGPNAPKPLVRKPNPLLVDIRGHNLFAYVWEERVYSRVLADGTCEVRFTKNIYRPKPSCIARLKKLGWKDISLVENCGIGNGRLLPTSFAIRARK